MRYRFPLQAALAALPLMLSAAGGTVRAATVHVPAHADLQAAIAAAAPGDTLRLASGEYRGNIVIDKPIALQGPDDRSATLIGEREGRTIWIKAPDVSVRHLTVRQSGLSLPDMDAGIFLDKTAHRARIVENDIIDNLVGVYVWGPENALVTANRIEGNKRLRVNERGNGVTIWNSPGSRIEGNIISYGRDGIFSNASRENVFSGNHFTHVRYAVHYMYTNKSEVSNNVSIGNEIAYALMFSQFLTVRNNIGIDSTHQGLMLNATQQSTIEGNIVDGAEKGVFIYNANFNRIADNIFKNAEIGVHYTAGSEGNEITNNAFVNNQNQVKYVGTRFLEWSVDGRGNYWSDMSAFDLNGDGIGDTAYRPNGLIDQVIWRAPSARMLLNSPAVAIVRWAQTQFPAILPGGVIDSAPLMTRPTPSTLKKYEVLNERRG
ncbi:nitrous oxide reductase family maturation protein NosD [Pusillimonas sp. TS35]|uniref:nitrous oxide reductase family maturation protein NosD n=1 Tax=Paracandidimonas lactea TaxID=2895524 RepID=UPI00136E1C16|nr:nitrous oxide reductase family maturation protein NosD [Paracandidimonas lactea]MYN12809.1 nitrous oxide reductase family maturation protein NosD [Pusillimonas sp. TS35]